MKKNRLGCIYKTRQHQRKYYSKLIFFNSRNRFYKGCINNISPGGVFIKTKDNFSLGQVIKVFIPGSKIGKGVVLNGAVAHLSQRGIGLKFRKNKQGQIIQHI